MKKRAISLLLVFAMVTGLFIGISFDVDAEDEDDYELSIAGVQVTSAQPSGEGWSYDYASNTLTLDGLNVENNSDDSYIRYDGNGIFIIVLKNTNIIESNYGAIQADDATVKIEGNGNLHVTSEAFGYDIKCKDLEIANGDVFDFSDNIGGIIVYNNVTISGGYVGVQSRLGDCIHAGNNITISGGKLDVTSLGGNGIYSVYNITISGGTVDANGYYYGIYSGMDIEISGGKVIADGEYSDGIYSVGKITISGGKVDAKSKELNGISSLGVIEISGGTVDANSEGANGINASIFKINDGVVNAKSCSDNDNYKAVDGLVTNNMVGVGFDEATSTQGTLIPIGTMGRTLNYKKVSFPLPKATVDTAPTGKTLTYDGTEQQLVTPGQATGGTLQYALGTETEATTNYSTEIPKGKDAKTYYVWYKAVGDETHADSDAKYVTSKINPVVPPAPTSRDVISGGNQFVAYGQPASFEFDIPFGLFQQSGKVYVDGVETDSKNYDAKPGSTIITLKDEFIKTLSEGAHEILVTVEGYEASTSFTVKKVAL